MNIVVTGGAGFIGSNLAKRLVQEGHNVTVIDNLLRGNKLDKDTFSKITFIKGDVCDYELITQTLKNIDIVFHFAAILGVDVVADVPVETMDVETVGTRNIVKAALENKVKRIIYASTSGIYGHSVLTQSAYTEEILVDPRTSYAMAKRYNEIYLASNYEEKGLSAVALRFFNVYGVGQDNRMVVPRFFEQALQGKDITVFGDGNQTRDFTYIDDAVDACIQLMNVEGYHIVNIANETEWKIGQLAEIIKEITNSDSKIIYLDAPSKRYDYEVERRVGSSNKLMELTGIKPRTQLKEGLLEIYNNLK